MEDASQLVLLNPDKAVTFLNVPKRQRACLTITNYSNCQITFKMKSTNPRLFRMNPVYGIIGPRSEADVILTFKGCLPRISPSDRFTVVIAFLTGQLNNASQAWKDRKMKQSLEMSSFKKRIKVQYLSERPTFSPSYEVEEDDLVGTVQKARVLKRRGLVEDDVAYHCTDPQPLVLEDDGLCLTQVCSYSGEEQLSKSSAERTSCAERSMARPRQLTERPIAHPTKITDRSMPCPAGSNERSMPRLAGSNERSIPHLAGSNERSIPRLSGSNERSMTHSRSPTDNVMARPMEIADTPPMPRRSGSNERSVSRSRQYTRKKKSRGHQRSLGRHYRHHSGERLAARTK